MAAITNSLFLENAGLRGVISEALCDYPKLLEGIYSSYYRYVLQVCRHFFWRQEDAEDAAAEVFLKLHTVLQNQERPLKFRPWLSKVTGRHCIDKLRQRQFSQFRCEEEVEYDALPDRSTLSPLSRVLLREEQRRVRDELRRLPRHYRIPLVMHYYRQMTYEEIAVALGKELPAIKTAIFRARRILRGRLLDSGKHSWPRNISKDAIGQVAHPA